MIFYELLVLLGWVLFSPKLLVQKWLFGKSIPTFKDRLGFPLPKKQKRPIFWIHAVSLGEMKASRPLCKKIKQEHPEAFLFLTTATATGKKEAELIPEADSVRYLPLDLSWIQKAWMKRLRPKLLLLIEGDVWINQLKAAQQIGAKTVLVSGKLSERSHRRYAYFPWIARKLYKHLDLFLVQNAEHATRFIHILQRAPLSITGNLKLAQEITLAPPLAFPTTLPIVALTCTHGPEEEELLPILLNLPIFLVIAPRHPERFEKVAQFLTAQNISFLRDSHATPSNGEKVFLLDAMGKLPSLYRVCKVAILGGSFSSQIGGHNPLEPLFQGAPVIFGPFMQLQQELASLVLQTGMAKQATTAELTDAIQFFLTHPPLQASPFLHSMRTQVLEKTWEKIQSLCAPQVQPQGSSNFD